MNFVWLDTLLSYSGIVLLAIFLIASGILFYVNMIPNQDDTVHQIVNEVIGDLR